jgi:Uma2 family endonuclease
VEILSPSTSQVDAHEKLHAYRTIASLDAYILVSQKRRLVQIHRRAGDAWLLEEVSSGTFRVCDADVSLDALYAQIGRFQGRS